MQFEQLESLLRSEWQTAQLTPETADLGKLWKQIEVAIAQLPEPLQLQIAGDALLQLAELCQVRSAALLADWEDAYRAPVAPRGFFSDLVRQTMTVDMSDLIASAPPRKQRVRSACKPESSLVAPVSKAAALALVEQLEAESQPLGMLPQSKAELQAVLAIAHEEAVSEWIQTIHGWLQAHTTQQEISLMELTHRLKLPWSHLWLGVLLGGFELEQRGDFYSQDIWVQSPLEPFPKRVDWTDPSRD
ncbi:hypothetical protein [Stenomitos frigidus]|uniref:Uncharacterized protein n=1 Tax=Stenomitos frigidus ULC18 TaxID=2107698 RepID=A0A2T1EJZ3_9CYAN|nr:hypothetical protein [Stenomitos frigidus]PSB33066.1 hypothetical protein C7B82_04780 [Stenomitos frigidus ULC18]